MTDEKDLSAFQDALSETSFIGDRTSAVRDVFATEVGPKLCMQLNRVVRMVEMFSKGHNQTRSAAREFADWLEEVFEKENEQSIQLQMSNSNFFINGQLVKLDTRTYATTVELRSTFLGYEINQIVFLRGIRPEEILALVEAIRDMKSGLRENLTTFSQAHIQLMRVAEKETERPDQDDPRRELIELYAGLLIKCSVFFHRLENGANPSSKELKRLTQRICDEILAGNGDIFVGLINIRILTGPDFVHAVNTSIYAMLLALEIGLGRLDVVRCGMTALTQDIDQMASSDVDGGDFQTGDETHFHTNLSAVVTLSQMGATDVLSALRLVTGYERGFPFNKPLPETWYREELRPHLLSRINEIARHYDVLAQGIEGDEPLTADRALNRLMMKMGSHYDPLLMKLFVNVVGVYPVGAVVELSTRERAVVLRSPSVISERGLSEANRPTVRLIDSSERILDLSLPAHEGVKILRVIPDEEVEDRPGAFFLF